jgi:multidrug efflux pump subunit AcrA (membrane-fusion protein)
MNGRRIFKWIIGCAIVGGLGYAFFEWSTNTDGSSDESATIGTVSRGDVVQRVTMIGTIKPQRSLIVQAPYKGFVRKIFVKIGDHIKRGAPLITIAQATDQPDGELFPIRSTLDGIVSQVQATEGESVSESSNFDAYLLRVDDVRKFKIQCDTPEIDVVKLKPGQKAIVRASAVTQKQFKGSIENIARAASAQDRWNRGVVQYRVDVSVDETSAELLPGMTASVDVITAERRDVLRIAQEYIQPEDGKYFAIPEKGEKIEVKIGLQDESSFEIVEGLAEGQRLRQVDFIAAAKKRRGRF